MRRVKAGEERRMKERREEGRRGKERRGEARGGEERGGEGKEWGEERRRKERRDLPAVGSISKQQGLGPGLTPEPGIPLGLAYGH